MCERPGWLLRLKLLYAEKMWLKKVICDLKEFCVEACVQYSHRTKQAGARIACESSDLTMLASYDSKLVDPVDEWEDPSGCPRKRHFAEWRPRRRRDRRNDARLYGSAILAGIESHKKMVALGYLD